MRHHVEVSPEMVTFIGSGPVDPAVWPEQPVALAFRANGTPACYLTLAPDARTQWADDAPVILIVAASACRRIFGFMPKEGGAFHLPPELAAMALSIRDNGLPAPSCDTLRLAKSIELLCETWRALADGALIPLTEGIKSRADAERILAARQLIEERWDEKLTLDSISRACGLNRAKLTRGFRDMFQCSVGDAVAVRRLKQARQMLLSTDLPVSTIGYRCGYTNNASFSRAFQRSMGVAPTQYRARQAA